MKRALPLSSLMLAALCACGGAKSPAAAPAHDPTPALEEISRLTAEVRDLQRDGHCEEDIHVFADEVCCHRDRICGLADQVGGNAWAAAKCGDARRACRTLRSGCARLTARPLIF